MRRRFILLICALLSPLPLSAHSLRIGAPLPKVAVAEQGELLYQNENYSYRFWDSTQMAGKIYLIQHMAARSSASEMNAALVESIKEATLPAKYFQMTTILNEDDALLGGGAVAAGWMQNNKKIFPGYQYVLDAHGNVRQAWGLQPKSSAIVVLDARGRIRYVKEGALSLEEIREVMALLRRLMPAGAGR